MFCVTGALGEIDLVVPGRGLTQASSWGAVDLILDSIA